MYSTNSCILMLCGGSARNLRHLPGLKLFQPFDPNWHIDNSQEIVIYSLNFLISIYHHQFMLPSIVIKQMYGLTKEDIQALLDSFACIVRTLIQRTAIEITDARYFRGKAMNIINVLMRATDIATCQPLEQNLAWHLQIYNPVDALPYTL